MRRFTLFLMVLLLALVADPVLAQTSTDTPTPSPTATPAGTATNTPTPSIDPASLYSYVTLQPDGQPGAVIYTITAGEALNAVLEIITIGCLLFLCFLGVRRQQ